MTDGPLDFWYALYTKPRAEKKVRERLEKIGFRVFAPTQTQIKQWSDRKKKVEEPFFKSYVFVQFTEDRKYEVLNTSGVVSLVNWLGKPAKIRNEEILAIEDFLNRFQGIKLENLDFKAGQKLRVSHGDLEDTYGTVIRQSKHRVTLEIEQLGMALYAEVPKSQVENIEKWKSSSYSYF